MSGLRTALSGVPVGVWTVLRIFGVVVLMLVVTWLLLRWLGISSPLCGNDPTYGPCD